MQIGDNPMKNVEKKPMKKCREIVSRETQETEPVTVPPALLGDLQSLIESARVRVAVGVNAGMVLLYWDIGERIKIEVLKKERAAYGEQVVNELSNQLTLHYGPGFTRANLFHMIHFVEAFPDRKIVYTLCRQLSWSHFRTIIYIDDSLARDFYTEMCRLERWSVRTLQAKIQGMLFERTALSKKPEDLARKELAALRDEDKMTPDLVFRSPYFLDFLGLSDTFSEKDLENSILRDIELFILELGTDFSFIGRQKRITIDGEEITTSICSFITENSAGLLQSISNWGSLRPLTKGRWSCTCAGWTSTIVGRVKKRLSGLSSVPGLQSGTSNSSNSKQAAFASQST